MGGRTSAVFSDWTWSGGYIVEIMDVAGLRAGEQWRFIETYPQNSSISNSRYNIPYLISDADGKTTKNHKIPGLVPWP